MILYRTAAQWTQPNCKRNIYKNKLPCSAAMKNDTPPTGTIFWNVCFFTAHAIAAEPIWLMIGTEIYYYTQD